jgi:hypothetical protein
LRTFTLFFFGIIFLLHAANARGAVIPGIDAVVSGVGWGPHMINYVGLRSRTYMSFGSNGGFNMGPLFGFDILAPDVQDLFLGGTLQFGNRFFFGLDGGVIARSINNSYGSTTGKGLVFNSLFGLAVNQNIRFSLLLSLKSFISGIPKELDISASPLLGVRLSI